MACRSFAAFGLARHVSSQGKYFSAITFSDPKMIMSPGLVFTGVPVSKPQLLPQGQYVPTLSVANFYDEEAVITVKYAPTLGGHAVAREIATLNIPAKNTRAIRFDGLEGDEDLRNSFIVSSNLKPGEYLAKLVSKGTGTLREVELVAKDEMDPLNGGNHPWSLENGVESSLLLFNHGPDAEVFNVVISDGSTVWSRGYYIGPMQTEMINLRSLIDDQVPDNEGKALSRQATNGEITWWTLHKGVGKGRLLESNRDLGMARSFSCGTYVQLCTATFNADIPTFGITHTVGYGHFTNVHFGRSSGETSCYCDNVASGIANYSWTTSNSSVAPISGSSTSSYVSLLGAATGTSTIHGTVSGASPFCTYGGGGPADVCDFSVRPGGVITAAYCDDINENTQDFYALLTPGSPASCVAQSSSTCSVTSAGNVSIDYTNSYMSVGGPYGPYCHVLYWASGNPPPPYTGQQPGTYDLTMDIKFNLNDAFVSQDASGPVTCK